MISAEKRKRLEARMSELGIKESELEERFVLGSGKGGQKVNKTASCVWLKHPASGIELRCQQDRSQAMNRHLARKELCARLEEKIKGDASRRQQEFEKLRRKKRKRSRRAKLRILELKKRTADKKDLRKTPHADS
jgi:protein subunit release factor B